jgi:glucose-6-phosphate isomerase
MEVDADGHVTKNSYGVFSLCWQAEQHPEWAGMIESEVAELRKRIRQTHAVPLRCVIWAGMGGSAEDKSMYNAIGLLRRGARVYVLDSTDPAKLKAILDDIENRSAEGLATALKSTLVVGMAMGMTSYEPVVNLEKLAALYEKHHIDSRPNFVYMTLPNSLLDKFGRKRGYTKVELQPDDGNSTAGRHSAPLTRGSLYPLALCGVDLNDWIENSLLTPAEIETALQLAAFLYTQATAGRNKITLLLPKAWSGAALWTKQDFEESLGKREDFGLKIVIGERPKLANYRPPKDPAQDRCFLAVLINGSPHGDEQKIAALRRAGYPIAILKLRAPQLSRYMQLMHYSVFGIAWLARMNFVTQPSVELYKTITNRLYAEAEKVGGIEQTREWKAMQESPRRVRWRHGLTLSYDRLPECVKCDGADAAGIYAGVVHALVGRRTVEYGELTFFGDTRYSTAGRMVRKVLDRAGERIFRHALKTPVDVYEGPAMNHSYHEMIIGHGRCFSTVLLSEDTVELKQAGYSSDYHRAQFLATQMALAERGRHVVAITLRDLSATSLRGLDEFFSEVAKRLKACGAGR